MSLSENETAGEKHTLFSPQNKIVLRKTTVFLLQKGILG
jgi:hypothetical protein